MYLYQTPRLLWYSDISDSRCAPSVEVHLRGPLDQSVFALLCNSAQTLGFEQHSVAKMPKTTTVRDRRYTRLERGAKPKIELSARGLPVEQRRVIESSVILAFITLFKGFTGILYRSPHGAV